VSAFDVPVFLLLGISVVMYLVGFCSPALVLAGVCAAPNQELQQPVQQLTGTVGVDTPASLSITSQIFSIFTNPFFLSIAGISVAVSFILAGLNFSVTFIIPVFIVTILIGFFILPISFIFSASYDPTLKIIFGLLINTMLVLSIAQFVRSG
jgi:hypothetical protein